MSLGRAAALFALAAATAACEHKATHKFPPKAEFAVTGHGTDKPSSMCEGFRLTAAQAKKFFEKSAPISEKTLHDEYDYLPCWVEGTVTGFGQPSKWKIRPIGIGEIRRPDGSVELRGCKKCDDLFR